jgi:hypothetical protein
MKRTFKSLSPILIVVVLVLVVVGCSTVKEHVKMPVDVSKLTPKDGDYLGKGVVLAGVLWETDGFYSAKITPVKIITQATVASKGEYEVMLLTGSPDITKGSKHWTKNVILKSHPAKKDELKPGMVILYTGGDPCKENWEELKGASWGTGVILNTNELYKDIVELKQCGGYRRIYKRHLSQLRISDDPVIKAPKEE